MNKYTWLSLIVLYCFPTSHLLGQTKFFFGTPNNNLWSVAANWNPSGVPTANDDVEIGNLNTVNLSGISPTIKSLKITARGKLIIDDPSTILTIQGANNKGLHVLLKGNLELKQGTINIINAGTEGIFIEDNESVLMNHGTIAVQQAGTVGLYTQAQIVLDNQGVLFINQFMPLGQPFCIQATQGMLKNSALGHIIVNYCQSSDVVPLQIDLGAVLDNQGQVSILPSLCLH